MTSEKLHSKSDIAAELAWRDAEIERLKNKQKRMCGILAAAELRRGDKMSYEGYYQCICEQGHYYCVEAFQLHMFMTDEESQQAKACSVCQAQPAWFNAVDDTNGDLVGFVSPDQLAKLVIKEHTICTCRCGHTHESSPTLYRPPNKGEVSRFGYDNEGAMKNV